jgi:hypothetical protein
VAAVQEASEIGEKAKGLKGMLETSEFGRDQRSRIPWQTLTHEGTNSHHSKIHLSDLLIAFLRPMICSSLI